ncbi:putative uncharacterized protein [Prevotella sp. CAG:873]|nr:putative uncharacterized protein [Prevotella sp. CAG:873]
MVAVVAILGRGFHRIVGGDNKRPGACKHRRAVYGSIVIGHRTAFIHCQRRIDVHPVATFRENHRALYRALRHHRSHHDVSSPKELVGDTVITSRGCGVMEIERAHQRPTLGGIFPRQGIVVRQPAVAFFDKREQQRSVFRIVVRLCLVLCMSTQHRREHAQLHPAHIQLVVSGVLLIDNGKSTDVMPHIPQARKTRIEHYPYLWLESAPSTRHISGPWEYIVTLQSCGAAAHHGHHTAVGVLGLVHFVHYTTPVVTIEIMVLSRKQTVGVQPVFGMHLRLAQITPPGTHTTIRQCSVAVDKPLARLRIRDIEHSSLPHPDGDIERTIYTVLIHHKHMLGRQSVIIVDAATVAQHVGLSDGDHVDMFLFEVLEHVIRIGPLLLVPLQASHVLLAPVPI